MCRKGDVVEVRLLVQATVQKVEDGQAYLDVHPCTLDTTYVVRVSSISRLVRAADDEIARIARDAARLPHDQMCDLFREIERRSRRGA